MFLHRFPLKHLPSSQIQSWVATLSLSLQSHVPSRQVLGKFPASWQQLSVTMMPPDSMHTVSPSGVGNGDGSKVGVTVGLAVVGAGDGSGVNSVTGMQ